MKKADVKVGGRYYANVSGKRVEVRIDAESPHGGWDATNLATGKKVRIKTAQRLHGQVRAKNSDSGSATAPSSAKSRQTGDGPRSQLTLEETKKLEAARDKKAQGKATADGKAKKLSAIDAAAKVLSEADEPMNAKELITAMAAKGLWTSPGGKTPHATLYSAMVREISVKGDEARFKKVERGRFKANA